MRMPVMPVVQVPVLMLHVFARMLMGVPFGQMQP